MFPGSFLPVVFLLCAAVNGVATANLTTQDYTSDGGTTNETSTTPATSHISVTASSPTSSNRSTSSFPTLPPSSTLATTTINTTTGGSTTIKPSTTHADQFRTTTASVTESSDVTTSIPDVSPSAPTSGKTTSTTIRETSQTTDTMTGNTTLTHSTEPSSGNTTASSTTTPATSTTHSTGSTISGTTNNSTIGSATTMTSTTQRPTDVTTNNATIGTGTTMTSTTQRPTDVTTNNATIGSGTTMTSTTQRPTDIVTTNNSTTTPTSTISTGTTTNSTTSSTAPMTTIIPSTTQQPIDTTTNKPTTAAPPIPPVLVCPAIPCPPESVCLNGTCQCLSGSFFVNGRCAPAQVFPGRLHLTSLIFNNNMTDRSSAIFRNTSAQISKSLRAVLKDQPGYKQSDVVRLEPGSVQATVNNIFEDTTITQESITQAIKDAIANPSNELLSNAEYTNTNLCEQEPLPCDVSSTMCTNSNGNAVCSCKQGYISILYSNTSCRACPSGEGAVGNICQPCAFGYSGFNCNDSALLAVVVVSCVLGGVLLIVLALLIYGSCNAGCNKPDYSSSPYSSGDLNQAWPTGITRIPRASANLDAAPHIEMTEGGTARVLVDKDQSNGMGFQLKMKGWKKTGSYDLNPEGMKTFKGKTPSRYSYLVEGHENPYFLAGDQKKN
uniref:SEA domain-containing protein n=1 Tax=Gasterosteus aculeatus aculeatus TaxID=481459 RepID=A0AAQ4Q555_GASAC|nr:protein HEG isoform X1 [Gasterosteus aculeatus aculeatus]